MSRKLLLPLDEAPEQSARLARLLKALRRRRGLTASEVARRMGMKQRTYELFEAGGGALRLERVQKFADATGSDPYAILMALAFEDEELALRCADNKLMTAIMMSVQDFSRDAGADLSRLDARLAMQVFDAACAWLVSEAQARGLPKAK